MVGVPGKKSVEEVLARVTDKLSITNPSVKMDKSTFVNVTTHARFYCDLCGFDKKIIVRNVYKNGISCNCKVLKRLYDKLKSINSNFQMDISTFTTTKNQARFYCDTCHYERFMKVNDVIMRGSHCKCSPLFCMPLSVDEAYSSVMKTLENSSIYMIKESYVGTQAKARFVCDKCGYDKCISYTSVKSHGLNCFCFRPKPEMSKLYILGIYDCDNLIKYKVGITTKLDESRLSYIRTKTHYDVHELYYFVGLTDKIKQIEFEILKLLSDTERLSKKVFGDGYTETFSVEDIDLVINHICLCILRNEIFIM